MQFDQSDPKSHLNPKEDRTQRATDGSLRVHLDEHTADGFVAFVYNDEKGSEHIVKAVGSSIMCSCPDFYYRGADEEMCCKHILASFLKVENTD